jgi:periplasmic protein TonB
LRAGKVPAGRVKTRPFFLWKQALEASLVVSIAASRFTLEDTMFAESMLETSWAQRTQRSWTTLTSFALQAAVLGGLLTISLMTTVGLPENRVLQPPISWGAPPPPLRNIAREHTTHLLQSNLSDNILIAPPSFPHQIRMIDEIEPPPQLSYNATEGVDGGTGNGSRHGIWGAVNESLGHVAPIAPPAVATKPAFRTSSMLQGSLVRRVDPVYPPLARSARIQGQVVLAAIISKAGTIEHLQVLSGHPMLVNAALEAVSQWRYRPYVLNAEVIEVETQITVNFKLN